MIRLGAFVVLLVVAAVFAICGLRYRVLPWQTPHRIDWCGVVWERAADHPLPDRGPRHPVTRQPPLIGTQFFSRYSAAQRDRRSKSDMVLPCGGDLFTVEDGRRIPYFAPG